MKKSALTLALLFAMALPTQAEVISGDLKQGIQLYNKLCASKEFQEKGKCTLYHVAASKGWVYFVYGGEDWSGSGVAKLEKGSWKVLSNGGGAIATRIVDLGCPVPIAKELLMQIMAYDEERGRESLEIMKKELGWFK